MTIFSDSDYQKWGAVITDVLCEQYLRFMQSHPDANLTTVGIQYHPWHGWLEISFNTTQDESDTDEYQDLLANGAESDYTPGSYTVNVYQNLEIPEWQSTKQFTPEYDVHTTSVRSMLLASLQNFQRKANSTSFPLSETILLIYHDLVGLDVLNGAN